MASSSSRTFTARLHPIAARFNLNSHLKDVTLATLLAGDTCAPISLAEFEKYLTFVEYSVETLQFLVWFQDYRERYLKFNPSQDGFAFGAPSTLKAEERAAESIANIEKARTGESNNLDMPLPATPNLASPTSLSPMLPPHYASLTLHPLAMTGSKSDDPDAHNFGSQCSRAIATFLTPGSSKELSLDAIVRDTVIRNLSMDCHPDAFIPVYEEVYSSLEQQSLPRFLVSAGNNINLPKQIYWYAVGTFNMIFGIMMVLLLIMLLPTPPDKNRAWRIFSVGFFALGAGQVYSAWRGYCSQVWMRGATQLRVWEMQEMDAEAKAFVDGIQDQHTYPPQNAPSLDDKKLRLAESNVSAIAPFSLEAQMSANCPSVLSDAIPSYGTVVPVHNFHRPPVFGPEVVVLDPRIKALHRQILTDTIWIAVWFGLAFSAIIFSVPSRVHPHS